MDLAHTEFKADISRTRENIWPDLSFLRCPKETTRESDSTRLRYLTFERGSTVDACPSTLRVPPVLTHLVTPSHTFGKRSPYLVRKIGFPTCLKGIDLLPWTPMQSYKCHCLPFALGYFPGLSETLAVADFRHEGRGNLTHDLCPMLHNANSLLSRDNQTPNPAAEFPSVKT